MDLPVSDFGYPVVGHGRPRSATVGHGQPEPTQLNSVELSCARTRPNVPERARTRPPARLGGPVQPGVNRGLTDDISEVSERHRTCEKISSTQDRKGDAVIPPVVPPIVQPPTMQMQLVLATTVNTTQVPLQVLLPMVSARLETRLGQEAFRFSARRKDRGSESDMDFLVSNIFGVLPEELPELERQIIEEALLVAFDYAERAYRRRMARTWTWTQFRSFAIRAADSIRASNNLDSDNNARNDKKKVA